MNATKLRRHYKEHSSGYRQWAQGAHARDYLLYPQNLGPKLSIDEVELSQGECYTLLTNKAGRGGKGSLVACIRGTTTQKLLQTLSQLPLADRLRVEEVTMDMAPSMDAAIEAVFPQARRVTDRFHVAKLAVDAVQRVRIDLRWLELDKETAAIKQARAEKRRYEPETLENDETPRQLLARLRSVLMLAKHKHTLSQTIRRSVAFQHYPQLERAYNHGMRLREVFELTSAELARRRLNEWLALTWTNKEEAFYTVASTVEAHFENILNYFHHRSTNAGAESFNAKIKRFRANQRGVQDVNFFLFRLEKLFA